MPEASVSLIEHQWQHHSRWLSFGGAVCRTPLSGCKGIPQIPQGDPSAPVALALLLSLPAVQVRFQVPEADTLPLVDDRSVVARCSQESCTPRRPLRALASRHVCSLLQC